MNKNIKFENLSQQDKKSILENNNIIFDLILKNSKITTVLNMLLDYNNFSLNTEVIVEPKEYELLETTFIKAVELLTKIYQAKTIKMESKKND